MPGVAVAAVATAVAMGVGRLLPTVSPLLIAIVLGAVAANTVQLPATIRPGLTFSSKKLLRVGIALLGLQLMLSDIVGLGWGMIAVVVAIVTLGITGTMVMGSVLGLSWTQRLLIACGFSICGAAATAAVDGVVDAKEEEVLTAVALVVLFGTLMIPTIPLLSRALGMDETTAGMWAGGSIHEVAQVIAGGRRHRRRRPRRRSRREARPGGDARSGHGRDRSPAAPPVRRHDGRDPAAAGTAVRGRVPRVRRAALDRSASRRRALRRQGRADRPVDRRDVRTRHRRAHRHHQEGGTAPLALAAMSTVWVAAIALVGVLIVN